MADIVTHTYIIKGLSSQDAAAIEQHIVTLSSVSQAKVDSASQTLTLKLSKPMPEKKLTAKVAQIVSRHGASAVIQKQFSSRAIYFTGLNCADCAHKIEAAAAKIDGVESAHIDFMAQKLTVSTTQPALLSHILRTAARTARDIEPDLRVSYSPPAQDDTKSGKRRVFYASLILGAALFAAAIIIGGTGGMTLALYLAAYLLIGGQVVLRALKNILKGKVFDENFLMSLATVSAFAIGEHAEGVAVMLFYQVGELFQDIAINRSRRSITALMDIRPDFANLQTQDGVRQVPPEQVGIGDVIVIRPGEKIPLDGVVKSGESALDTSALTGESMPRDVESGSEVLAGSINTSGLLAVTVTKEFGESTLSKILTLVQSAGSKKTRTEAFITRFSRYYTPAVVAAALALAVFPPLITGAAFTEWLQRALVFLVVSCPCALVISIPLGFFGGIGGASRNGILVKGSSYLEALGRVDTAVFDKTGTLTRGVFKVTQIVSEAPDTLLYYAACAESSSTHPIAVSIRQAYGGEIDVSHISELEETAGFGIRATVDSKQVLAGNSRLLEREGIGFDPCDQPGTVVYVAIDGHYAGCIVIADELRPDSAKAITALKKLGVKKTAMLTGDSQAAGEAAAHALGLDAVYTGLLPDQKVEKLELLRQQQTGKGTLAFVGDGINDAPVLAMADIGIAMGGAGSDAAIEAADVVLMTDEPYQLTTAIRIARKTRRIVWQNIVFALGVKAVILILGAFGIATMWEAVFGDVGVALLAIINAMRALRVSKSA